MSGLYDILIKIKNNPGQCLGETSLPYLFVFLNGRKIARQDLGIEISPEERDFYREFQPWIQKKLKVKTTNSWANIIQLFCINDREAFKYFFELLTEFKQREKASEPPAIKESTWKNARSTSPITADKIAGDNFNRLLNKIEAKPALYIGKASILSLQAFLDGCDFARRELNLPLTAAESEFQEFLAWVRVKFHVETEQSWSKIILFHSADENHALERFFQLYDEFLQRQTLPVQALSPTPNSPNQENKKQLLSLVNNLSESAAAKVREFAESLNQM